MPNGTMKALLAVLFVSTLYLNLECANNKLHDPKIIVNTLPKKVLTLKKNIHIKNPRKFEKLGALDNQKASKKPVLDKNPYTVFPPNAEKKLHDKPVSIHFQGDVNQKSRVKKVLPEYGFSLLRNKRSADPQVNSTGKVAVSNKKIKRKRFIRKRIKRKGKTVRNSTLKRNKSKRKSKIIKDAIRTGKIKNTNLTKKQNVRIGKQRTIAKQKQINKHRNQTKLDANIPKLDSVGSKKLKKAGKPKQERKVTREQDQKVRRNRRLIAGRDAMIQDYPYVVSIQKDHQHWCAGALLSPRLVITTANCVWKAKRVSRMRVRAGSRHMERGGQLVKIQEVAKHPKWSIRTLPDNDVALLLLSENIKFSDSVHAVDLPNRAMWPAFEDVWVTSWGAERRDGIFTSTGVTLQVYHAMLVDHEKCNNVTMRFGIAVSQNFFCVAQTGRRAPCTRDTGAPAVSDGILWGLASWGIRKLCGTERFPAMFSYLASRSNLDFITNATHYLMSDKRYYPYDDRFVFDRAATSTDATTNL